MEADNMPDLPIQGRLRVLSEICIDCFCTKATCFRKLEEKMLLC